MGDYPCQKFRYGFAIGYDAGKDIDRSSLKELDEWYQEEIPDEREEAYGFDGGLGYVGGHTGEGPMKIFGVPILADECIDTPSGGNVEYLGGYHVGAFDVDGFLEAIEEAREMYEAHPEIEEKLRDVLGEHIEGEASVVTASGWC